MINKDLDIILRGEQFYVDTEAFHTVIIIYIKKLNV